MPTDPTEIVHFSRIQWLAQQALVAQSEAERLCFRLAELGRVTLAPPSPHLPHLVELHEALERHEAAARRHWAEVERLGGVVADEELGFVDFPRTAAGRRYCLCWQPGESTIGYWHESHEPCSRRKPLDSAALQHLSISRNQ